MAYSTDIERAREYARRIHAEQKDKNGMPYIGHLERVAGRVKRAEEKVVAYLHDSIEDTETTFETIERDFGTDTATAVQTMTHANGESYEDYIERVHKNPICRAVKISDLIDNSNLSRLDIVTRKDVDRQRKYNDALIRLVEDP